MNHTKEEIILASQTAIGLRTLRIEDVSEDVLELHDKVERLKEENEQLNASIHQARSDEGALADDFQTLREAAGVVVDTMVGEVISQRFRNALGTLRLATKIKAPPADEGKGVIKPSHFTVFPCSSLLGKSEAETVAQNIMVVCARRGDRWGELTREDYQTEREKDGDFTVMELSYFDQVYPLINSLTGARAFASVWAKVSDENRG